MQEGTRRPDILNCVFKVFDREDCSHLKILSPKQMFQRLPIVVVQVKTGDTSENLLNEIPHIIIYFLNQAKEITEKL